MNRAKTKNVFGEMGMLENVVKQMLTHSDNEETKIEITYCYKSTIC